ncbi:MAG: MBOAT family protein [Bacteroidetes bacterium]|nr:MBOAT family protein [Bacteroidota bacterium]
MLFNSLQFLVFFLVITLWFFRLKKQGHRNVLLLIGSCYFYMSFVPKYILILGFTIIIDYLAGLQISRSEGGKRKTWLVLSIMANVGILAYYKYFNFLIDNLNVSMAFAGMEKKYVFQNILLPIGLSFHTFQAMSYTIEVYRGNQQPERNFATYALYVMFYPQLVAGPIERPQNMLHQFHEFRPYNWSNVKEGLTRMLWGFFKKVVVADRLALLVDHVFDNTDHASWQALAIGAIFYSVQIYCDFSGYCDIGIGAAKVMNINLMENFKQPYISNNISTFWKRWHISLSTWFRDYVYIPMGGNKKGALRRRINVMTVFMLSGLWHGANWKFVMWGFLHGLFVMLIPGKNIYNNDKYVNLKTIGWIVLNFVMVTLFWIFFRADSIQQAFDYIQAIFSFRTGDNSMGLNVYEIVFSILLIGIILIKEYKVKGFAIQKNSSFYWYVVLMIIVCYWFGVFGENQFIYFQF